MEKKELRVQVQGSSRLGIAEGSAWGRALIAENEACVIGSGITVTARKYTCYRKGVINTGDLLVLGLSMWLRQKIEELTRPPGGNRSQERRPEGPKPRVNPPWLKACRKVSQCGVGVGVMWPNPASPKKGTPVCTGASLSSTREPGESHLLGCP